MSDTALAVCAGINRVGVFVLHYRIFLSSNLYSTIITIIIVIINIIAVVVLIIITIIINIIVIVVIIYFLINIMRGLTFFWVQVALFIVGGIMELVL